MPNVLGHAVEFGRQEANLIVRQDLRLRLKVPTGNPGCGGRQGMHGSHHRAGQRDGQPEPRDDQRPGDGKGHQEPALRHPCSRLGLGQHGALIQMQQVITVRSQPIERRGKAGEIGAVTTRYGCWCGNVNVRVAWQAPYLGQKSVEERIIRVALAADRLDHLRLARFCDVICRTPKSLIKPLAMLMQLCAGAFVLAEESEERG